MFNKYYDMVKDREIKTSLGLSCYEAVDNIKNFLNGRSDLLCEGTEALQDLKICIAISKKAKINKKILLFSHDLGGANMILPLVKPLQNRGYKVLLYGKRLSLDKYSEFKLKGVNIIKQTGETTPENIDRFIDRVAPDFIITGTSAMDMTERYLWRAASKHKVPSFALLDNWINYSIRFSSGDTTYFPTKICIVDDSARGKIFMDNLSGDMLLTTGNPYFEFLLKKNEETIKLNESSNRNLKNKNNLTILFVSEPISKFYKLNFNSEKYLGYTEKTIFENIYKSVTKTFKGNDTKIRILIKLHPQDNISGYNKILKKLKRNSKIKVVIVKKYKFSNWNLINSADIVCGMGSTLLTEAFLLRKPVLAVHIGLKKDYPSTFDKTGLMKSIRSQSELDRRFRKLIEKEPASKYNYGIIKNPIKQIISAMERILWQN